MKTFTAHLPAREVTTRRNGTYTKPAESVDFHIDQAGQWFIGPASDAFPFSAGEALAICQTATNWAELEQHFEA
jgi:hypothetical protein